MGKLRLREAVDGAQGHTAGKRQVKGKGAEGGPAKWPLGLGGAGAPRASSSPTLSTLPARCTESTSVGSAPQTRGTVIPLGKHWLSLHGRSLGYSAEERRTIRCRLQCGPGLGEGFLCAGHCQAWLRGGLTGRWGRRGHCPGSAGYGWRALVRTMEPPLLLSCLSVPSCKGKECLHGEQQLLPNSYFLVVQ